MPGLQVHHAHLVAPVFLGAACRGDVSPGREVLPDGVYDIVQLDRPAPRQRPERLVSRAGRQYAQGDLPASEYPHDQRTNLSHVLDIRYVGLTYIVSAIVRYD